MLQCWYMCDCCVCCATSLKKVMVAWCECIPRRCCVTLRIYVGKYVIVVIADSVQTEYCPIFPLSVRVSVCPSQA